MVVCAASEMMAWPSSTNLHALHSMAPCAGRASACLYTMITLVTDRQRPCNA